MSLWIKIVIGIVGFVVLTIAAALYFTAGLTRAADGFFQAVAQQDMTRARGWLASGFKARTDEQALRVFLSAHALTGFKESHWSSRKVENGRGSLRGTIVNGEGAVLPIGLDLIREDGSWKIYAIHQPEAGLSNATDADTPAMPDAAALHALVKRSMHDFAVSAQRRDMSHFHGTLSPIWQQQISAQQLDAAFKPVTNQQMNLLLLDMATPVFTVAPAIDENDVLVLKATTRSPRGASCSGRSISIRTARGNWLVSRSM